MSLNDLQQTDPNFMEPFYLKYNQLEDFNKDELHVCNFSYLYAMRNNGSQNKRQNKTKWSQKNLNKHLLAS